MGHRGSVRRPSDHFTVLPKLCSAGTLARLGTGIHAASLQLDRGVLQRHPGHLPAGSPEQKPDRFGWHRLCSLACAAEQLAQLVSVQEPLEPAGQLSPAPRTSPPSICHTTCSQVAPTCADGPALHTSVIFTLSLLAWGFRHVAAQLPGIWQAAGPGPQPQLPECTPSCSQAVRHLSALILPLGCYAKSIFLLNHGPVKSSSQASFSAHCCSVKLRPSLLSSASSCHVPLHGQCEPQQVLCKQQALQNMCCPTHRSKPACTLQQ